MRDTKHKFASFARSTPLIRGPFALSSALLICLVTEPAVLAQQPSTKIQFGRDVRSILSENCFACHGFDEASREADLRLDTFEGATGEAGGAQAIVPGKPDESELVARILSDDPGSLMPPEDSGKSLSPAQKETLRLWIEQGA